ncbi:MAG: CDP-glycerol--glycerophosphate glycerophosphotransferase [Winogradskyella sp.]|uniref:CDP-glycerol glycerophosphotransferase family protein n=1 Tax=Winogradskyella sp. TaxID=1883156 RepID=UPI0017DFC219|nr:CDP-glycerol glycerophosphotransferase family protein [Winogradskyella sp.]MBT8245541.1 CDP-glycerol glycerophosphotransferase family protein [Winogradskyella sp.]NNK23926.1 CDP-glycerol--glycerophosphate glycerophosphotransferase [Winogradskyella sp.]
MKTILFCQNNYAFGILEPIRDVLKEHNYDYLWFVTKKISINFPYDADNSTSEISDLVAFKADAIFAPGNEVPYYLRGLKVQIFHGLAGEKKGHFRIRHYFDLYLTQGPYFTRGFKKLNQKYKNFDVIETGWSKLDIYGKNNQKYNASKSTLLQKHKAKKILLYAPTFSPKLTSAPFLLDEFKHLAENTDYLILIKFHPLMAEDWIIKYKALSNEVSNIIFQEEKNIIKFLLISDILISDTSSVIYEFLLLNKPVVTFKNISKNINWEDSEDYSQLKSLVEKNLNQDPYAKKRDLVKKEYHPYDDGLSAERMVNVTKDYIKKNGVPSKRKLPFLRRLKIHSIFGKLPS